MALAGACDAEHDQYGERGPDQDAAGRRESHRDLRAARGAVEHLETEPHRTEPDRGTARVAAQHQVEDADHQHQDPPRCAARVLGRKILAADRDHQHQREHRAEEQRDGAGLEQSARAGQRFHLAFALAGRAPREEQPQRAPARDLEAGARQLAQPRQQQRDSDPGDANDACARQRGGGDQQRGRRQQAKQVDGGKLAPRIEKMHAPPSGRGRTPNLRGGHALAPQ